MADRYLARFRKDGKLYCTDDDCFAGEIVAVAMDDNMKKSFVCFKGGCHELSGESRMMWPHTSQ
ncbi:hypothetical protein [Treponema parvum]|uniref:hypothetical protein n=1 Tax=Treponema parvum TaxID=138851 RepID=UPI001BB4F11C|nr:hypothetical protein [Treponema parvum]QTQ16602.1 hypothetical protein HXT04_07815 [Treponema parvum]